MHLNLNLKLVVLLGSLLLFSNIANASLGSDPRELSIVCNSALNNKQVLCDYRHSSVIKVENIGVKISGKPIQLTTESFSPYPADKQTTAILFLVDTSDPARKDTIEKRIVSDLVEILSSSSGSRPHLKYAIATFDTELNVISSFGSTHSETLNSLAKIRAKGLATEFYKSILDGLNYLNSVDATRKALVIMSDGKDEDRAYRHDDVIKHSRDKNIVIMGLGYAEKKSDYPHLQTLRRLSDETHGIFNNVTERSSLNKLLDDPFAFIQKGGRIAVPVAGFYGKELVTVEFGLVGGQKASIDTKINISDERPLLDKVVTLLKKYGLYIALLLTVSVLSGFYVYRLQKKMLARKASYKEYGYLIEQSSLAPKYTISKTAIRIGRSEDNDICLMNDSISSHHAELHIRRDSTIFMVDLNSTNGVHVNGIRVTQQEIKDGDLIELGEVRLKFVRG